METILVEYGVVTNMLRSILPSVSTANYEPIDSSEYETLEQDEVSSFSNPHGAQITHDLRVSSPNLDSWSELGGNMSDSEPPNSLIRSVSCEGSVPLSHPTPDLQTLQGAYASNIERLEQSAERLSLTSDIGGELRKLDKEQTRLSSRKTSLGLSTRHFSLKRNSIIGLNSFARSGGNFQEGSAVSHDFSLSPPRSCRSIFEISTGESEIIMDNATIRSEPEQEGRPLDSPITSRANVLTVRNSHTTEFQEEGEIKDTYNGGHYEQQYSDRPGSSGSGDTFRRALNAFADFDGVHISDETHEEFPVGQQNREIPDSSTVPTPFSVEGGTPRVAPNGENNMVFYPAPVPAMLNLPQKLSKAPPASKVARRKSQMLQMNSPSDRRSTTNLSNMAGGQSSARAKHASQLPPQLRATVFFEHPPLHQDLQLMGGSAVATLDSILDASAHAPVSAFTDHPIAGQLGAKIYSSTALKGYDSVEKKNRRSTQLLGKRQSIPTNLQKRITKTSYSSTDDLQGKEDSVNMDVVSKDAINVGRTENYEETPLRHSSDAIEEQDPHQGIEFEHEHEHDMDDDTRDSEDNEDVHIDKPMTLLAELQIRKQQQNQRNRTAATAFPNGMHSTLLQLDAVAQVQKQARKQKHITLAWEDPSVSQAANEDPDEDIPLGVLFPSPRTNINSTVGRFSEDRPLGLLAQRALEDNEPLRQRRARLRGEPLTPKLDEPGKMPSMFNLEVPGVTDIGNDSVDEEKETLAQRLKRLKGGQTRSAARPISGDFASEILSHFGDLNEDQRKTDAREDVRNLARKTPDSEETLGQRRRRLQAERQISQEKSGEASQRPQVQQRRSMADILQAHPGGMRQVSATSTPGISPNGLVGNMSSLQSIPSQAYPATGLATPSATHSRGTRAGVYTNGYPAGSYVNPMTYTPMVGANASAGAPAYPVTAPMAEQIALNPKQRAVIDRWRQSVL